MEIISKKKAIVKAFLIQSFPLLDSSIDIVLTLNLATILRYLKMAIFNKLDNIEI